MKTHKDVEYQVMDQRGMDMYRRWDDALVRAVGAAIDTGKPITIDVLVWSRAGARQFGGDDGVERYDEDPEASVFERVVVRAESKGRVA